MELKIERLKPREYPDPLAGMTPARFKVMKEAVVKLERVIKHGSETDVHAILEEHPELFRDILPNTGHHGLWFHSKPSIRPHLTNGKPGKIPDFLLAGRSSFGYTWFVVELKSPQVRLFTADGRRFSPTANLGLNQIASYLEFSNKHQSSIRESLEIDEFRTPKGILILGKGSETETDDVLGDLKTFWNDQLRNISIVSYTYLAATARNRVRDSKGF